MKIERLPSGSYHARIYLGEINGKKKFKSVTAPTAKEVKALIAEYNSQKPPLIKTDMTVREAAEQLIEERDPLWSATYRNLARYNLGNRFLHLQKIKIAELDRSVLQKEVNAELARVNHRTGKRLTVKTVRSSFAFFTQAILHIDKSVDTAVSFPRIDDPIYHTPAPDMMSRIFAAVKNTEIELPVLLAATMSLRTSEIRGLQWQDIENDTIHVRRALVLAHELKQPKTAKSTRVIPISPPVAECLKKIKRGADDEFVYQYGADYLREHFKKECEAHGINPPKIHELRHAFASAALAAGIPEKYIMVLGGWSSNAVLRSVYQQTFPSESASAIAQISAKMMAKNQDS